MILIVQYIEEVTVERMNILNFGEILKNVSKSFIDSFLAEFNLNENECTFRM